jgi:hypothetical protein
MNTNISAAQLAANRANAQHSTGPRTTIGRSLVSLNAVPTGLPGETVVLSDEDGERYRSLLAKYEKAFLPVGIRERELVQSLIDIRWRLNRIPGLEAALDTYARNLLIQKYAEMDKTAREFFLTVDVYNQNEKQLKNIHFHEARLARRYEKEVAMLTALQAERKAKQEEANDAATKSTAAPQPATSAKPAAPPTQNGFEFANPPATAVNQPVNPSTPAVETPEVARKTAA